MFNGRVNGTNSRPPAHHPTTRRQPVRQRTGSGPNHPTRLLRVARPNRTRPTTPGRPPTLLGRPPICSGRSPRPHAHCGDNLDADRQTVVVPPQRHVDRRLAIDVEPRRERHKLPPASSPRDNPTAACSRSNRFRVRTHPTRLLRTARPDRTRPTTPRHTPTLLGRPTAPDGSEGRETWVRLPRVREMKLTRGWSAPTVFGSGRGGP
jgi:hypothetical protein